MSINLSVPQNEAIELKPRISVVGVGGAGGNAVNNMIAAQLEGVEFLVANTDAQALAFSKTDRRIQLGSGLTQGLGAGSKPEIGRAAAEESIEEITEQIKGSHMVFIAAGMGGGTGSGAAPVIARTARDLGVLTVGVVTKPFQFEGQRRQAIADKGIEDLEQYVDTLIVIPNQNLFRVANEKTTFADAFKMADDVLYSGVRGITDLMVMPGLINLDFADVRSVMSEMGKAMMGTGEAEGERRALDAAEAAISNPLLDDTSMAGANGVLINITGGSDMTLYEVDEAANRIRSEVDDDAYIIFGSTFDDSLEGSIRVSVVATGIDAEASVRPEPAVLNVHSEAVSTVHVPAPEAEEILEILEIPEDREPSVAQVLSETTPDPVEGIVVEENTDISEFSATNADIAENIVNEALAPDMALDFGGAQNEFSDQVKETLQSGHVNLVNEPSVAQTETELFTAPAAMPSALNEDPFIPSEPVVTPSGVKSTPDPMAEAAIMNGALSDAREPQKPSEATPSLFARVTGGAMSKVSAFGQKSTPAPTPPAEDDFTDMHTAPAQPTTTPVMRSQSSVDLEPTLGGLDPQEQLQQSQAEPNLLDIPAFLRRQAN
ncbi:MAG: cell division protein FtsZ [Rhodospirillaceae bacterium]|nr:MAG: cell division protein FtsZ [Rhodospirillaceae bacterium]